jgi:hypothetical protein
MLKKLKWEKLETRRRNIRLMMLYKIKHNLVDVDRNTYIQASDRRTRGQERLFQERVQNTTLFNSFFPRTIRDWNALSPEVANSDSLEIFRHRLMTSTQQVTTP